MVKVSTNSTEVQRRKFEGVLKQVKLCGATFFFFDYFQAWCTTEVLTCKNQSSFSKDEKVRSRDPTFTLPR